MAFNNMIQMQGKKDRKIQLRTLASEIEDRENAYNNYQDQCEKLVGYFKRCEWKDYDRRRKAIHKNYIEELKKIDKRYSPKSTKDAKKYEMLSR